MPKKMKLDLNDLNVNSFKTADVVKGGGNTEAEDCSSIYRTKFCTGNYCTHAWCELY
mgnify:CR=1 FL=1